MDRRDEVRVYIHLYMYVHEFMQRQKDRSHKSSNKVIKVY